MHFSNLEIKLFFFVHVPPLNIFSIVTRMAWLCCSTRCRRNNIGIAKKQSARDIWHVLLNVVTAADVFATSSGSRQPTSRLPRPWLTAVVTVPPDSAKFNSTREAVDQEHSSEGVGFGPFHHDLCMKKKSRTPRTIIKSIWSVFQNKAKQTVCKNHHVRLFYGEQFMSRCLFSKLGVDLHFIKQRVIFPLRSFRNVGLLDRFSFLRCCSYY